jgi:SNF2 family DNA or RNA helicase
VASWLAVAQALIDRMFNPDHFDSKWYIGSPRVVALLASGRNRNERTHILNNHNREKPNANHLNLDILVCTTGKLGVGENLTGGNWLILFEPPNSVTTWKQAAARNVRLDMRESTYLFQFETEAPYETLMLDRLKTRETSQAMIRSVLGDEILQELGMLPTEFAMQKPAPACWARRV